MRSFIETQFPVSQLSKESYKERKAGSSQTLTGLGKWWGRKPLVLVRATVLGLLLPATDDPQKDREVFMRLMTMDAEGRWLRREKAISVQDAYRLATSAERATYFISESSEKKAAWKKDLERARRQHFERQVFERMSYDEQLTYCARPEQVAGPSEDSWKVINAHLGTKAENLNELVEELGMRQFGHRPKVGDAFCGGGSIPFEAARIGCDVHASDLNPAAALLTWAALNIVGGGPDVQEEVKKAQEDAFNKADEQVTAWGIEHNEKGWRADAYLYCIEAKSPSTGYWVPLAPSWVISEKYKVCAVPRLLADEGRYALDIITGATEVQMKQAKSGTVQNSALFCPETGNSHSITSIRGDRRIDGATVYGLRMWENDDVVPRPDDTFQERLYCIRYIDDTGDRHYVAPNDEDLEREKKVLELLKERFDEWQEQGIIPSKKIERGFNTEQPVRERGWTHWHHLFNPRQLLVHGLFHEQIKSEIEKLRVSAIALAMHAALDRSSRLCGWDAHASKGPGSTRNVFFNQALNTQYNYASRPIAGLSDFYVSDFSGQRSCNVKRDLQLSDARTVSSHLDFWITDPPYADAVNYHELGEYFSVWQGGLAKSISEDWYIDGRSALAVKGTGSSFNQSMVECYSNFTKHMPDNGAQVVMFTHQDAKVWADLALILWASGLQVTQAWTIQTETDAVGIKTGNYVQGTVCMILRKQTSEETAFLFDIQSDVEFEVKQALDEMLAIDDKEEPNFGDTDYQLAAYVAALRVITRYKQIEDIDVQYELSRERTRGEESELQKIIDSAVAVACEYLVPDGISPALWRSLNGEERFYVKALEIQSHGEYRNGVMMELARGFGLKEYQHLLKSGKANETRLATPSEFKNRQLKDGTTWGDSLLRNVLFAVRETSKTGLPVHGRMWLYNELPGYWETRKLAVELLNYIGSRSRKLEAWEEDWEAVGLLRGYLDNDSM